MFARRDDETSRSVCPPSWILSLSERSLFAFCIINLQFVEEVSARWCWVSSVQMQVHGTTRRGKV